MDQVQEQVTTSDAPLMESKPSRVDLFLQEKLENAFHKKTSQVILHDIAKIAMEHSPIDLAYAAFHLPPMVRPILYDNLPNRESKIKFIVNASSDTRLVIFRYMNDRELKKLFEKMPTDEAVDVLEDMSERRYRRVMELIDSKKASKIQEQKRHLRNSAGRLMITEFFAFDMDKTIKEASNYIHDNPRIDFTKGIFITKDNELQGYVPARNMVVNSSDVPLSQVMRPIMHKVLAEASREEVVDIIERYKLSSLPVVNGNNELVGVITQENVVEAMEDMADEMFAKIGGTAEKIATYEPLLKRFFARSPWLLVTLIAGFINFGLMSSFQRKEGSFLTYTLFFVPLITGMSGNIGVQCSTVLIRSMALGLFSLKNQAEAIIKELLIGMFTGGVYGLGTGFLVALLSFFNNNIDIAGSLIIGLIVGAGLIGACLAGTFLGVFSPIFFSKIGIDPAISSGPIVTAFNDVLSMSIYFLISYGLGLILLN